MISKINRWRDAYQLENEVVLDGYGWSIQFQYGENDIHKVGYAKMPYNYRQRIREIQEWIERLCERHTDNYSVEGVDDRMKL